MEESEITYFYFLGFEKMVHKWFIKRRYVACSIGSMGTDFSMQLLIFHFYFIVNMKHYAKMLTPNLDKNDNDIATCE